MRSAASQPGLVAVVGAGFAGLALGCTLARAGRPVTIVERRSGLPTAGAALAIQPNGLAALERLDLLDDAMAAGSRIEQLVLFDRRGRQVARADYTELDHPHPSLLVVRRIDLLKLLADEVERLRPGALRFGTPAVGLIRSRSAVCGLRCRSDGAEIELHADCVAGADGISSTVREALSVPLRSWTGEGRYVVGVGERPAGLEDGTAWIHHGPGYADGVMPLGDDAYFYNAVTAQNHAAVDAGDLDEWRRAYGDRLPYGEGVARGIASWGDLSVLHARPQLTRRRTADGAALLGDAAAAVHPHSAQGANLAIEDGVALGELIASLDPTHPPRRGALAPYERERGRKAKRYVAWSRFVGPSFDGATAAWRANRWLGWQWMRVPPVRREMLRIGAGLR